MTRDLFESKQNFCIKRITAGVMREASAQLHDLRELILTEEGMYPRIDRWFDEKVVDGLKNANRVAYVGYLDDKPIVSAVVKSGRSAKFCHLKVDEVARNNSIGEIFFTLMTLDVRRRAERIYFTLPEGLWESKKGFFRSFGFESAEKNCLQYRKGETELMCSTPFSTVFYQAIDRLPKIASQFSIGNYSLDNQVLLSVSPLYADMIISGGKKVEVRRRFSQRWTGTKVNIYATSPWMAIVGEANIEKVVESDPKTIWEQFGADIGSSKEEFDSYCEGVDKVSAILLSEVRPFHSGISLEELRKFLGKKLMPPQSFSNLANNEDWAKAVTVASILQGQVSRGMRIVI